MRAMLLRVTGNRKNLFLLAYNQPASNGGVDRFGRISSAHCGQQPQKACFELTLADSEAAGDFDGSPPVGQQLKYRALVRRNVKHQHALPASQVYATGMRACWTYRRIVAQRRRAATAAPDSEAPELRIGPPLSGGLREFLFWERRAGSALVIWSRLIVVSRFDQESLNEGSTLKGTPRLTLAGVHTSRSHDPTRPRLPWRRASLRDQGPNQ